MVINTDLNTLKLTAMISLEPGAFFIPYTLALLFLGLPLFLMELAIGQYSSEGPITVWKMNPLFSGIGYAMFLMSSIVGIYVSKLLFAFIGSLTTGLLCWPDAWIQY